ncbi:cyclic nucleotide-binding domain-containing protein [Denitrobaculum tricleocarpae]|uniref:Cyclic nucleotide-binding domain-containing protein n=1 Tax=Denitrobaculum tricleocarpae TaxID=2591009 RepID=A0A545TUF9_9PROT|nr:cyclic nucleotide-binding domain-containing protein [Denitrobaculum tricleocarpae]TQV80853.1 cyclic nucleotide-binding domain-containing protein [Denitrobaculum tricleocarpae]
MTKQRFERGDIVFREGGLSDSVFRVISGEVEIVKELQGRDIALGRVGPGEYFGEMGVIEGRPRSATVKAVSNLEVETIERDDFLHRVSEDADTAFELMQRLSERLHTLDDAFAASVVVGGRRKTDPKVEDLSNDRPATGQVKILADSDAVTSVLPAEGLTPQVLPFFVGRHPVGDEALPPITIDLPLHDSEPHRLAKVHFSVAKTAKGFAIRDFRTELGTKVNEVSLGEHFSRDVTLLNPGENSIVAGGGDSPFRFRIVVGES